MHENAFNKEKALLWDSWVQSIFSFQRSYLVIRQGCLSRLFVIFDHAQQNMRCSTYMWRKPPTRHVQHYNVHDLIKTT